MVRTEQCTLLHVFKGLCFLCEETELTWGTEAQFIRADAHQSRHLCKSFHTCPGILANSLVQGECSRLRAKSPGQGHYKPEAQSEKWLGGAGKCLYSFRRRRRKPESYWSSASDLLLEPRGLSFPICKMKEAKGSFLKAFPSFNTLSPSLLGVTLKAAFTQ